jgi:hypothetical protein
MEGSTRPAIPFIHSIVYSFMWISLRAPKIQTCSGAQCQSGPGVICGVNLSRVIPNHKDTGSLLPGTEDKKTENHSNWIESLTSEQHTQKRSDEYTPTFFLFKGQIAQEDTERSTFWKT